MSLRNNPDRRGPWNLIISRLAVLLIFLFLIPRVHAQSWKPVGPAGGDVRFLAIDPNHRELVYLGTTDGHIFGSRDRGEHWNLLGLAGTAANAVVTTIIVDPQNSQTLYTSTWTRERDGEGGGVYRSTDGGISWQETGLSGHAVRALAQSPSDPGIFIAGALDGVFRFDEQNQTWVRISPAADPQLRNFDSISIDPFDPDVIYAGTFHLPWKTMDGGQHWIPIHRGMKDDSDVLSLVVDPGNPRRIFAAACSGIYRSEDAGSLWREVRGIPNSSRRTPVIRVDPSNPATLYAGTTEGLWKSADGGVTWRRVSPADWVVNTLAIEPTPQVGHTAPSSGRPGRILVGTEGHGVFSSDDGGAHFRDRNAGFFHRRVVSWALDARSPATIAAVFAGAHESVAGSDDGGRTWVPLGSGLQAIDVQHLFSSPDGFVAAFVAGGIARFDREKGIWTRWGTVKEGAPVQSTEGPVESSSNRKAFLAHVNDMSFDGTAWFAATSEGLFGSEDAGAHWKSIPVPFVGLPVNSVHALDGGRQLRIVAALAILFSDDAGATWDWHDLPLESGGVVRLEFADDSTALAVAHNGLYVSRDAGNTWNRAAAGLPQGPLTELLLRPHMWLASVGGSGLYVSRDQGDNWLRVENHMYFEDGIGSVQSHTLAVELVNAIVFPGSSGDAVYVLDLPPASSIASGGASGK